MKRSWTIASLIVFSMGAAFSINGQAQAAEAQKHVAAARALAYEPGFDYTFSLKRFASNRNLPALAEAEEPEAVDSAPKVNNRQSGDGFLRVTNGISRRTNCSTTCITSAATTTPFTRSRHPTASS